MPFAVTCDQDEAVVQEDSTKQNAMGSRRCTAASTRRSGCGPITSSGAAPRPSKRVRAASTLHAAGAPCPLQSTAMRCHLEAAVRACSSCCTAPLLGRLAIRRRLAWLLTCAVGGGVPASGSAVKLPQAMDREDGGAVGQQTC